MFLPVGYTEAQVLEAIEACVRILTPQFAFPGYPKEDLGQEAYIWALEALPRFDPTRPLDNFLYAHLKRRLINFRRDRYRRADPPCLACHEGHQHEPTRLCKIHERWVKRNNAKAALNKNATPPQAALETPSNDSTFNDVAIRDAVALIDKHLDEELRGSWLRMRAGCAVPRVRRMRVEEAIRRILGIADD